MKGAVLAHEREAASMSETEGEAIGAGSVEDPIHPVKRAATTAFRVYRAVDKLDRWSGGGQTLALVVKVSGWVGLLFILFALVVKLNEVARRLDPVTNGITKLAAQLDSSRSQLAAEDEQRRASAERLAAATKGLDEGLEKLRAALAGAGGAESDAARAAAEATHDFRAAQERLRADDEHARQDQAGLIDALAQSQKALAELRDLLGRQRADLAKSGADAVQSSRGAADAGLALTNAVAQARAQVDQVERGLAQIDLKGLQAAVARATDAADERARAAKPPLPPPAAKEALRKP